MDPQLQQLINDCSLIDGQYEDYYFNHGKCCITQTGALKIQRKHGIELEVPTIGTAGGRVVVHGKATKGDASHWTTGEGNPMGKAVEGSHPVAMAEKRWRVRCILGLVLDPEIQATVYGADEFEPGGASRGSSTTHPRAAENPRHDPGPTPPPAPATGSAIDPNELVESWGGQMGRIAELTGMDRNDFENDVMHDCGKFPGKEGWVPVRVATFKELANKANKEGEVGKWARSSLGKVRTLCKQLEETSVYETSLPNEDGSLRPGVKLSKAGAAAPQPDFPDDTPF